MAHNYYHCGTVTSNGLATVGPFTWPRYSHAVFAYWLSESIEDRSRRWLVRSIERRMERMADYARCRIGGSVHGGQTLSGGYSGIGLGEIEGTAEIPAFMAGTDYVITFAFQSESLSHAEASALDTWLNIERYKTYLDVYKVTGGEIHVQH